MGIKNLTKFIKTHQQISISNQPIELLKNKTLCIDTPCLLYKLKFSNINWYNQLINFIYQLVSYNIDIVFVFEGKAPELKKTTQEKRKLTILKTNDKSNLLCNLLEEYKKTNIINEELLCYWKTISNEIFNENDCKKALISREKYKNTINNEDYILLKKILECCNITWIQSDTEAETTCAKLKKQNLADYIYTNDSDILAYIGVDGFINNINFKNNSFVFINKTILLKQLNLTEYEFLDFCIMCGTDYNTNIEFIGISKSLKFIQTYKNIENIPIHNIKKECLKFSILRTLFETDNKTVNVFYTWPHFNKFKINNLLIDFPEIKLYNYVEKIFN